MSTDLLARGSPDTPVRARRRSDPRTVRILRYAAGVTLSSAVAFAFEWPLFYLTPVLTAFMLSLPLPAPTAGQFLARVSYIFGAFLLGLVFTLFLLPYPLVYVPALGLVLFHIYYLANRGGPVFFVIMAILAVLILPMLAIAHDTAAIAFAGYFAWSGFLALVFMHLAHWLYPDPLAGQSHPARPPRAVGYSPGAAQAALKSTIVIIPIATMFISAGWASQILVMVFAAIFSLSPEISKGKAAGMNSLKSTLVGGLAAMGFYNLIVAVPEFHFFVALMFLSMLVFGAGMFSGRPLARYLPSAAIALIVLIGGAMGEDVSITDKLVVRVVLISLATLYIVAALAVLERYWPGAKPGRERQRHDSLDQQRGEIA